MEKLPEVKREEVKEPIDNKSTVSNIITKPFKELSKLLTQNNEKENNKDIKSLSSASSGISYPSGIERINDVVEKDKVSLQNSKVLSYLDSINKGVKLIATNIGNFKLSESESKSSGDFIDNIISNGTDKLIDLVRGRNRERNTRRDRINPRERNRRSRVSNQRQNRGALGKLLSVFGLGNNTENLLDISNSILPIEEQTQIPSGRIEPRPRPTPNRREGGIVSKVLSTAKSGLGKVGNLLEGGGRLLGKAALPLAIATSLYDAGTSAFNDEEIKKSTGKETVSVGDRISAGVGGTLGGIASIGDTLLSLGGIDSDVGGFVKDITTSSLSKLIDVGTDVINNTFSSNTISMALDSAKETISTQFTSLSESLGTSFDSLLEISSSKISEISSSIIDKGTSILTSAKESLFSFADLTSTLSSNLLTKTESLLDNSKSFISESISTISKFSSDGLTKIIDSGKSLISSTSDSISSLFYSNERESRPSPLQQKTESEITNNSSSSFLSELISNSENLLNKIISSTSDNVKSSLSSSTITDLTNNINKKESITKNNSTESDKFSIEKINENTQPLISNNEILNKLANNEMVNTDIVNNKGGNNSSTNELTKFNSLNTQLLNNNENISKENQIKITEVPFDLIQKFLDSFQSKKAIDLNNEIAVYTANKVANATAIPIVVPTPAPNVIVNSGNDNDQRTLLKPSIDPSSIRDIMRGFSYSMI